MSDDIRMDKQMLALANRIGDRQVQWAVPATVVFDVGTPSQRMEEDGLFAYVKGELHYFRKRVFKVLHEVLPMNDIAGMETSTGRFKDGDREVVIFSRRSGQPWVVFGDGEDRHRFLMEKLSER